MIVRHTPCAVNSGIPALGGALIVPRPLIAVQITGPSSYVLYDGLLDTGADETVLDPSVARLVGIDLTQAVQRDIHLVGRGTIRCQYAHVKLRITDGVLETYEWDTPVGFAPFPLLRNLLGFGGFLQFFDANFRGADEEVVLFPNAKFGGRII